jgi:predicted amidohydrolase YtcJ
MGTTGLHADTIIRNANIITMDPTQPRASALAIRGGKFAAVGSNDDISGLEGKGTQVLNLEGKTVVPGFIDAHIHVLSSGTSHVSQVDCNLPSVTGIQEALLTRAEATPLGQWVLGFKFDDTKTTESRFLTRHDLDAVSTRHPVMVAHQAGHVYFFNSLGLEAADFFRDTPDLPGGRLGRDSDT